MNLNLRYNLYVIERKSDILYIQKGGFGLKASFSTPIFIINFRPHLFIIIIIIIIIYFVWAYIRLAFKWLLIKKFK
jgi:hypothetical protein